MDNGAANHLHGLGGLDLHFLLLALGEAVGLLFYGEGEQYMRARFIVVVPTAGVEAQERNWVETTVGQGHVLKNSLKRE